MWDDNEQVYERHPPEVKMYPEQMRASVAVKEGGKILIRTFSSLPKSLRLKLLNDKTFMAAYIVRIQIYATWVKNSKFPLGIHQDGPPPVTCGRLVSNHKVV